jgi:AcrR family transcriptional regulator
MSTRTRRPRGSLTRDVILDAAEGVAQQGSDALSMRAVAAALGAAPMALYNHFATKDELVDALLDRILLRFTPPSPTDDWADDLARLARAHRRLLVAHAWAIPALFRSPNPGLGAVRIGEAALEILRRGGLTGAPAVAVFGGILSLNYGWSSFTTARDRHPDRSGGRVGPMLAALPADEFPLSVAVAAEMGAYGSDEHYEFVLGRLVAGLRAPA